MKKYVPALVLILIAGAVHFTGLGTGTPSPDKTSGIFGSYEEMKPYVPKMIELRNSYYSAMKEMLSGKRDLKETAKDLFFRSLKTPPYGEMLAELKLDAIRGCVLGVSNSDEQRTIVGISRLNPVKLQMNPGEYIYGGFYFYSAAASLLFGKIAGFISLSKTVDYYFYHPEEISAMYSLVRGLGALASVLSVLLVFFIAGKFLGEKPAFLAALSFSFSQLLLLNSHEAKPHTYGLFWVLTGIYFCLKASESEDAKNYIGAGAAFGLAGSALLPDFSAFSFLLAVQWFKNKKLAEKKLLYAAIAMACVFALTNFYLFFDLSSFLNKYKETSFLWGYGRMTPRASLLFISQNFFWLFNFLTLPAVLAGAAVVLREKNSFPKALLWTSVFLYFMDLVVLKHPMILLLCVPFLSISFAYGCREFYRKSRKFALFYASVCVFYFLFQGFDYVSAYRDGESLYPSAGKWINQNLPKGSSVGVVGGWFNSANLPPFRYMDYRLIHWPSDPALYASSAAKLPEYLVIRKNELSPDLAVYLEKKYLELKVFGSEKSYSRLFPKRQSYIKAEIDPVLIYKLKI